MIDDRLLRTSLSPEDKALVKLAYVSALQRVPYATDAVRKALADDLVREFEDRAKADFDALIAAAIRSNVRENNRAA